jgi:hypothetical protein
MPTNILETKATKIQIGNFKKTATFVSLFAEQISLNHAELYAVIELPLLNPAAVPDCEKVASCIPSAMKRSFRVESGDDSFELALSSINEELRKLVALGYSNWLGKLNAVVAVKQQNIFSVATCGKISAKILRDEVFIDLAETSKTKNAVQTFENFSVGKLKVEDTIILSTNELFNHISGDRLKNMLHEPSLHEVTQSIVKILKENAGPETAFGTFVLLQKETVHENGKSTHFTLDTPGNVQQIDKILNRKKYAKNAFSFLSRLTVSSATACVFFFKKIFRFRKSSVRSTFSPTVFQKFPKSFSGFFKSSLVSFKKLNLLLASRYKNTTVNTEAFTNQVQALEQKFTNVEKNFTFNDSVSNAENIGSVEKDLESVPASTEQQKKDKAKLAERVQTLWQKLELSTQAKTEKVTTLTNSGNLIRLPGFLATETNGIITSFNTVTLKTEDGALKGSPTVVKTDYYAKNSSVVFDGQGLVLWDFRTGSISEPFYQKVSKTTSESGLTVYPDAGKAYTVDTETGAVVSYVLGSGKISSPATWVKDEVNLKDATDITVDGNIFIYSGSKIFKYSKNKLAEFSTPVLKNDFDPNGKIYAGTNSLYLLDPKNNRVVMMDKKGVLEKTFYFSNADEASDFAVLEDVSECYILSKGTLYKFKLE